MSCWHAAASSVRSSANAETSVRSATGAIAFARGRELPRREVEAIGVALDRRARDLDARALARAHGVEELLAPHRRARVAEDHRGALLRHREVRQRLGQEGVGALLDAGDPHQSWLAEQRRRGHAQKRAGARNRRRARR